MKHSRIDTIDKDLAAHLNTASEAQLRAAALAAVRFGVDRAHLNDAPVADALMALEQSCEGTNAERLRRRIEQLVASLDEAQFDLQDQMDEGVVDDAVQALAFARARAANAVYDAFDTDPFKAATGAIYEARFAGDDPQEWRARVLEALNSVRSSS